MKLRISSAMMFAMLLSLAPSALRAQETARMAPPDAGVYIEILSLAEHRADWQDDPVGQLLQERLPHQPGPIEWQMVQEALGMTGDEIVDTFFGRTVAIIGARPGPNQPVVLLSRIAPDDGAMAIERLHLADAGKVGDFATYITDDGKTKFGFSGEWMAFTGVEHEDYFDKVVGAAFDGESLADQQVFQAWTSKLPEDRTGTVYINEPERGSVHVLGIVKPNRNTTVHYAGRAPEFGRIFAQLRDVKEFDFGPLPRTTLAAMTLNMFDPNRANPRTAAVLDNILAPKTFRGDVLPKLQAPVIFFLGEVPGNQLDEDPGVNVPVIGLAIRMKDSAVAADLDKSLNGLMTMLSVAAAASPENLPPLKVESLTHAGAQYHTANIGELLAAQSGRKELEAIKLTWGATGDWYMVATQTMFFRQAISAQPGDFAPADVPTGLTPIARGYVRPAALGKHIVNLTEFLKDNPIDNVEDEALDHIAVLGEAMTFYESVHLRFHRGADGESIEGTLEIIRE